MLKTRCIFAAIFDKVESQGNPREVLSRRISVCFCMVMANTDKINLHLSMSSSLSSNGNSISDTQTGSSNSKVFHNIQAYNRYIFRVVSKSKPKKSKITQKKIE